MEKAQLRALALKRRDAEVGQAEKSRRICERLLEQQEFQNASSILFYLSIRSEVATDSLIGSLLASGEKRIVIPFCEGESLKLFHLLNLSQLSPGRFGVLEPRAELPFGEAVLQPSEIELAIVPGIAFDRRGHRLGYGKGFYDRLLPSLPEEVARIGLAFDCQLIGEIPNQAHDTPMHLVLTESQRIVASA